MFVLYDVSHSVKSRHDCAYYNEGKYFIDIATVYLIQALPPSARHIAQHGHSTPLRTDHPVVVDGRKERRYANRPPWANTARARPTTPRTTPLKTKIPKIIPQNFVKFFDEQVLGSGFGRAIKIPSFAYMTGYHGVCITLSWSSKFFMNFHFPFLIHTTIWPYSPFFLFFNGPPLVPYQRDYPRAPSKARLRELCWGVAGEDPSIYFFLHCTQDYGLLKNNNDFKIF